MKPHHLSRWLALLVLLVCGSGVAQTETKRPDLNGVVKGKDGRPVAGASAFIYTAGPKLGVGFL